MTREARGLGKDRGQAQGRPQVGGLGYEGLGKDRVDFLEEVAPGLGLKGFGGRMTLGEDLLWSRHVGGWIQHGQRSGGGDELIPIGDVETSLVLEWGGKHFGRSWCQHHFSLVK